MKTGCLYVITSPSGKKYVGITTKSVRERFREHVSASRRAPTALARAMRKYGSKAFAIKALRTDAPWYELLMLERAYICLLQTYDSHVGYNMTRGGEGVCGPNDEAKRRHRDAQRRRFSDPAERQRNREAVALAWSDTERRQRRAESVRAMWADPAYRARNLTARASRPRKERPRKLTREKLSMRRRATMADPALRRRLSAAFKLSFTPERRAANAARVKSQMANPALRKKIGYTMCEPKGAIYVKLVRDLPRGRYPVPRNVNAAWNHLPWRFTYEEYYQVAVATHATRDLKRAIHRGLVAPCLE